MRCGTLLLATGVAFCQTADSPAFDVASVKLTQQRRAADGTSFSDVKIAGPGRLVAINASLDECVRWAYQLREYQVAGPEWLHSGSNYDIEAKTRPDAPPQQVRLMLQTLLAERFKLKVHREVKTSSVYEMVVAKNGPKLPTADAEGRGGFSSEGGRAGIRMTSPKATMGGLANWLSGNVDWPVLDKTGLSGSYAIKLEWAREGDGPSVFSAMQEQLGLRLQAAKAPIEVLVIDHAQKVPVEN